MNPVSHLESLVSISLASFEDQVGAILLLERNPFRSELIYRLKTLATSLHKTVNSIEREFVETIEEGVEGMLDRSATIIKVLAEARQKEAPIPDELVQLARGSHRELTARLSTAEDKATALVSNRLATITKKIEVFLERLEKL